MRGLVKKTTTDKNGKRTSVWVQPNNDKHGHVATDTKKRFTTIAAYKSRIKGMTQRQLDAEEKKLERDAASLYKKLEAFKKARLKMTKAKRMAFINKYSPIAEAGSKMQRAVASEQKKRAVKAVEDVLNEMAREEKKK